MSSGSARPADPRLRLQLGVGPGPLLGGARLSPEKNIELFLDVAAQVRQQVGDAQFMIVGDGPQRAALVRRAEELGLATCVHFLGWRSDVPDLMALWDAMLLTSHMEASPVSILEALATGIPVVATGVGSVPEIVDSSVGILVEPGDAAGMAGSIVALLDNPAQARSLAPRAGVWSNSGGPSTV